MTFSDQREQLHALDALLDTEREQILLGEHSKLAELSRQKENLVGSIAPQGNDQAMLVRIRAKSDRNASLLAAAQRGIRNAMLRLEAIRQARNALRTYDQDGRRVSVTIKQAGTLEHKA